VHKITQCVVQIEFYVVLRIVGYVFIYGRYRQGHVRKKYRLNYMVHCDSQQYVEGFFIVSKTYTTLHTRDVSKATIYFLRRT
jgi:pantothenate kinase